MSRTIEYVHAQNDYNGKPQRGWIVRYYDDNGPIGVFFIDEGFEGFAALRNAGIWAESGNIPVRRITIPAYRTLKRELPSLTSDNTYIRYSHYGDM